MNNQIDEALEALNRLVTGDVSSSSALAMCESTIRRALEQQRVPDIYLWAPNGAFICKMEKVFWTRHGELYVTLPVANSREPDHIAAEPEQDNE